MIINPNEGSVVLSIAQDLKAIDFDGDVNLVEKEVVVLSTAKITRGVVAGEEEGAPVRQPARRGCGNNRKALLGQEGTVGRRSDPVTIKQRGGTRRWL
ncbi:hypothetical protein B296_00055812 [Ensete ventricosum]|uniref:Uncharacterized protein n=1 Tax=Ensete ventricosum TaxID=4639 RepID=A0A426WYK0_ENSVE|nr:hypothetical protein B296_00055812 [Ensete ventricosum]